MDEAAEVDQRRRQNLSARRTDARSITPSIRSFAQAIDRQRQGLERIPLLRGGLPGLAAVAAALDAAEVAALAISIDDPESELSAFSAACSSVSVPVLRVDLLLEEFQVYESRAAGADAVLLVAALLPGELLARLAGIVRSTHMAPCVLCMDAAEVARAVDARAGILAVRLEHPKTRTVLAAAPRRSLAFGLGGPVPGELRRQLDAFLDSTLGAAPDPAQAFRNTLDTTLDEE